MKKLILILVALIGLVGSVSAKTFLNKTERDSDGIMYYEYIVMNTQIPGYYYVCCDANPDEVLLDFFKEFGSALRVVENNTELNSEVAVITKKHGVSITSDVKGLWILNVYENGVFSTYLWQDK